MPELYLKYAAQDPANKTLSQEAVLEALAGAAPTRDAIKSVYTHRGTFAFVNVGTEDAAEAIIAKAAAGEIKIAGAALFVQRRQPKAEAPAPAASAAAGSAPAAASASGSGASPARKPRAAAPASGSSASRAPRDRDESGGLSDDVCVHVRRMGQTKPDELEALFSEKFGKVVRVANVGVQPWCNVYFETKEAAEKAIAAQKVAFNGVEIEIERKRALKARPAGDAAPAPAARANGAANGAAPRRAKAPASAPAAPAAPRGAPRSTETVKVTAAIPEGAALPAEDAVRAALAAFGAVASVRVVERRRQVHVDFESAASAAKAETAGSVDVGGVSLALRRYFPRIPDASAPAAATRPAGAGAGAPAARPVRTPPPVKFDDTRSAYVRLPEGATLSPDAVASLRAALAAVAPVEVSDYNDKMNIFFVNFATAEDLVKALSVGKVKAGDATYTVEKRVIIPKVAYLIVTHAGDVSVVTPDAVRALVESKAGVKVLNVDSASRGAKLIVKVPSREDAETAAKNKLELGGVPLTVKVATKVWSTGPKRV